MELTRTADYAARVVILLAGQSADERITSEEIATYLDIPREYVPKVLQLLSRAGIVRTQAGRNGGVRLRRPPEEITLLDVVEAVEGPLFLNRCLLGRGECPREDLCPAHEVWQVAQEKLLGVLRRATAAKMAAAMAKKAKVFTGK